jgi:hypothetical protein
VIRTTKDGRTILSLRHYTEFRHRIYDRTEGRCEGITREQRCPVYFQFWDMELHHVYGRGGGKRDDVEAKVLGLCHCCHEKAVIQRREPVSA